MTASYLTISGPVSAQIEVKRSRFLAELTRVDSEAAAREVIDAARRTYWDARHHCSAMVIGPGPKVQRSSDDGEPAGTAGAPMLEVLRGSEVSDVVVVVTRWFGGVLLGAGGLVRAYGDAVRAGLDQATVVRRTEVGEYALTVGHADAGRVESELRACGFVVLDTAYTDQVRLLLGVAEADVSRLQTVLAELSGGQLWARAVGSRWVDTEVR